VSERKLYGFFRSSAAYRVRIALNLKGLDYEYAAVHLSRGGGEQSKPEFRKVNPQKLVPVLQDGALTLNQSLAIIEYLDEIYPDPPLLPKTPPERARVRALAQMIACEIHPLNNTRVLSYLAGPLAATEDTRNTWYRHWVAEGFQAIEARLAGDPATGRFCHGDAPGLADCCLVPQVFNARRFKCDLAPYPRLVAIEGNCQALAAFQRAAPEHQPDAE
jgi:maleylacetoacetate isomerase/maleylpyruvate isomerase